MVGYFSGSTPPRGSAFLSNLTCVSCATPRVSADREADGAGAPGVAQLAQEAGVLPAGPTGHRRGKKTRKEASHQNLHREDLNPGLSVNPEPARLSHAANLLLRNADTSLSHEEDIQQHFTCSVSVQMHHKHI